MEMSDYVKEIGLVAQRVSFRPAVEAFELEMMHGLAGKKSSLQMIPNFLSAAEIALHDKCAIAIDMGGTNLRIARVDFDSKSETHLECFVNPMPGIKKELSVDDFFDKVAELLSPFIFLPCDIGLCFSFPCKILPNLDGRILLFDKEIRVRGAEGVVIGDALRAAFERRNHTLTQKICVLNDTTAAMLGGIAKFGNQLYDGFVGMILGTGMNCCYSEKNTSILKESPLNQKPGRSVINIEAGGYAGFKRTQVDYDFDIKTDAPGTQLFEKMVSGAYLGRLLLAYIQNAAAAGCFTQEFTGRIATWSDNTVPDLIAIMDSFVNESSFGCLCGDCAADRAALFRLFDAYLNRVADNLSICLAAILQKADIGSRPEVPACICIEGSVFDRCMPLRNRLLERMYQRVPHEFNRHCRFVHTENATLIGAAAAALSRE